MEDVLEIIRQQAVEYFATNNYRVISSDLRSRGLHFLAKNLEKGNNETFVADRVAIRKFVHTGLKREPWIWVEVHKLDCPKKSKLEEMKRAIKQT